MDRRTFLQQTMAATGVALAASTGPILLGMENKSGSQTPVIGQGEHRYECLHNWGELPAKLQWQTTHGVCIDEAGFIYIKMQGHAGKAPLDTIVVFDPKGKFVRSFGKDYHPGGHGIDIRKEGKEEFLYLCDVSHRQVIKATLKGEEIWKLCYPLEPKVYQRVKQFSPTNVAFAPDGGFYIGDGYGSSFIHQYDKDARWVRTWGGAGTEPGKMRTPHGIWLDNRPGREPALVVADRANARLQYFTLDGRHISFVKEVLFPAHFDIRGEVLLVPDLHARVSLFDKDNKAIVHLGDDIRVAQEGAGRLQGAEQAGGLAAGQVRPSARCLLRQGWQYLCGGVGRHRPGDSAAEGELKRGVSSPFHQPRAAGGTDSSDRRANGHQGFELLQGFGTNARHLPQVLHALEWLLLACLQDAFGQGRTDAWQLLQVSGAGPVQVDLAILSGPFLRLAGHGRLACVSAGQDRSHRC